MVTPYVPADHYEMLSGWWRGHDRSIVPEARLPVNGFVVDGVAAAFFYCTDTETAVFEYCVSNPAADKTRVYDAIRAVTDACFGRARALGYQHMVCLTPIPGIVEFAKRLTGARVELRGTDTFMEIEI